MGHLAITAFMRPDDHYIIQTGYGEIDLTELWQSAVTPETIKNAIHKGENAAYSSFCGLIRWLEQTLSNDYPVRDERYLAELNPKVRDVLASFAFLEYVGRFKALPVLPPEVAALHVPMIPDEPTKCADCDREIHILCAECLHPWPCRTVEIPAEQISKYEPGIDDNQPRHDEPK